MFNPYAIILGLFIVAGLMATLWGMSIIARARKTQRWPMVEGMIETSSPSSEDNDLLPHILFSYAVDTHTYQHALKFPGGTQPSPELTASYTRKYSVGAKVSVYYNPQQPDQATLEPGLARGDWMILAIGITAMAFGIFALFFSG